MSLQILSLNSNQVPACAAAQEKVLALLPGGDAAVPKRFAAVKELFYAMAEALKTTRTILLLVEPERYLATKEQLLRALELPAQQSLEVAHALRENNAVQLPEEEIARHAATPVGAAAFPTQDGLFSGFMLTAGRQTILFLPLDNRRIGGILEAEAGAFLTGLQTARRPEPSELPREERPAAPEPPEEQAKNMPEAPQPPPEAEKETPEAPPAEQSAAEQALEALLANGLRVAVAATPTADFLREAAVGISTASERLAYSSAFRERGEEPAKQYAAELAQMAMRAEGTPLGAAMTNVYTVKKEGRIETFLLVAVADGKSAHVRRLYAQPDEHPGHLIEDGVQALYGLVEEAARRYGEPEEEEQGERPAHWKAFAVLLSVLLSLSILLCIGVGIFLQARDESSSQQASLSAANAPGAQQTQPEPSEQGDTQPTATQPRQTASARAATASPLRKPAAPARDQAFLDEIAQAMEDEINAGGEPDEQTTQAPESTEKPESTTEKDEAGTTKPTQPSLPPGTEGPTNPPSQQDGGKFVFTVYGYGHGVGMSQFGANEYSKSGWNYQKILLHYFPGVKMNKMDDRYPQTLELDGKQVSTKVVLARILEKEMGGSYSLEALKAQAVAAYTYILRQNRVTGVAISSTYSERCMQAVEAVLGEYMTYNGEPILATFFAYSAGKTSDVRTVWGGSGYPYLRGGCASPVDKKHKSYQTTYSITSEALRTRVKNALGVNLAGDPSKWLKIKAHDSAVSGSVGYVSSIQVGNQTLSGQNFRAKVMDYDIRSHCFTVTYRAD